MVYYFAYGSNMNPERITTERLHRPLAELAPQRAVLRDYALRFNKVARRKPGAAYANIVPCPGARVEGILYTVTEEDLLELDGWEGVPHDYTREKELTVELAEGGQVIERVQTYIACPKMTADGLKPTREYLGHLLAGRLMLSDLYYAQLAQQETL